MPGSFEHHQDLVADVAARRPYRGRVPSLGDHAELVTLGIGHKTVARLFAGCPMSTVARKPEQPLDLLVAVLRAAGQVQVHAVLDRLGMVTGMEHMPTGACSSVPMTISRSTLGQDLPAQRRVQNRASPGRS